MNAPFAPTLTRTMLLRILSGRLEGAEYRLPIGKLVRIGHGFDHDVVIRDTSTRGLSLELCLVDEVATVSVIAGDAMLLGHALRAGDVAQLPVFVPLAVGAFAVAIGDAESPRWADVTRLSTVIAATDAAPAAATPPRADLAERLATRLHPLRQTLTREGRWPLYGLGAATIVLVSIAAVPAVDWLGTKTQSARGIDASLAAAGFGGLKISDPDAAGGPLIEGVVRDDAALARLRLVVAERIGRARIDVETMQGMAAAATDMLRAQGLDADARPMRGSTLLITSEYVPPDRQAELGAMIRRDLPRVTNVSFQIEGARGDRDLQYFFSAADTGLATFVDGNPGYVVTADGTRWFAGSQVPTGHRIVSIGQGRVRFERAGQIEDLVIAAAPQTAAATTPARPEAPTPNLAPTP